MILCSVVAGTSPHAMTYETIPQQECAAQTHYSRQQSGNHESGTRTTACLCLIFDLCAWVGTMSEGQDAQ
ncbi:hypothetical protein CALVIDRAFT_541806 [Calocera viscosa TUFC12733]|uniref:Uncharacterized protein n=1 Tax=Calocera viscosa (strain TUFC12733) TaxID=1330018 RepID=A0A167HDQ9_CALVF|nr:hypothetical protein CALVIDRAFT_541806 [Calocera viscosa TUFC12733]